MTREPKTIDDLFELARTDPEALERYRQEQIRAVIENAPPYIRRRLQGLQFSIDMEREKHPDPLAACLQISSMMHDSFGRMRDLLNAISYGDTLPAPSEGTAEILQFPGSARQRK